MGFADGSAAFEARQEAARRAAAGRPEPQPKLSDLEEALARTKGESRAIAEREAHAAAVQQHNEAHALQKMATLSAEFGHRADSIGYRPKPVVTGRTELVKGFFSGRKYVYRFGELIGEGWFVTDFDDVSDWGSLHMTFLVMREGPWIRLFHGGTCTASGEARGLPRGLDPEWLYRLNASRDDIVYLTSSTLPRDVDGVLAKALIRAEQGKSHEGSI